MLRKEHEADDPFSLVGQGFPCPEGYDSSGEMARCFVEEFAMLGYPPGFVLSVFRNPHYQGPNGVLALKGSGYIEGLIREVYGDWDKEAGTHASSL